MNTDTGNLARALRNPLVVFGLVLLLGDGPLVIAYLLAKDPTHSALALVSLILFVFMIAAVFCYLALFRPRHLYAPDQIPESGGPRK